MMEELENNINMLVQDQNNRGISEFEGYSPDDMNFILYDSFGENSPIHLKTLNDEQYLQMPIMKQVIYLANIIQEAGELKLTQKGYLPTKVVFDLCSQNFLPEMTGWLKPKVYKEADSMYTQLARILLDLSGIIKKRYNKLSLTKSGEKLLQNNEKLFRKILSVFSTKFNWAYFDGYGDNGIGQIGFAFTLILLSKYGNKKRLDRFYSDKYFDAFPHLFMDVAPNPYSEPYSENHICYSLRSFDRFLIYFGLIEMEQEKWGSDKFICRTEMFDGLIQIKEPQSLRLYGELCPQ